MNQDRSKFTPTGHGNEMAYFDGFMVSFNSGNTMAGTAFQSDKQGAETALIVGDKYYILNGDFRADYLKIAPEGLDACLQFFASKPKLKSSWSNSLSKSEKA